MPDQKDFRPHRRDDEIFHLRAELEQVQTTLEAAQEEVSALADEREHLIRECRRHIESLRATQERHEQLMSRVEPPVALLVERERCRHTEEELRVTFEELQVLAEELEEANAALRRANQELDERVEERTRELVGANAALNESRERLSLALKHAGAGSWDFEVGTGAVVLSPEYLALTGQTRDAVTSRDGWLSGIVPRDRERLSEAIESCARHAWPDISLEYRVRHPARGLRWMSLRAHMIRDEQGRPDRLLGLAIDITDRKFAEARLEKANADLNRRVEEEVAARQEAQDRLFQQEKLDAIGQLTGGIAHDFNNLLMVVTSGLHLLSGTEDAEHREDLIRRMHEATSRGSDLTKRLLAFGRCETLRPEAIELRSRLRSLHDLLVHSLREDIVLETDLPDDLWPLRADVGALELALLNLTVNARDAMPDGGKVVLHARNRDFGEEEAAGLGLKPGAYVELSVEDTGSGMSRKVRDRVFEPFFTTKGVGKGSGLGLPQVYGFAQQTGGAVRLESEPGKGTVVTLTLPRADRKERRPARADRPRTEGAAPAAGPGTILVVEDDREVAVLVTDLLVRLGHRPVHVLTASAAMEALDREKFDLLFTDILLAGSRSGLDLAREVAQRHPDLPIVLTTGYGGEMSREVAKAEYALLRKPYGLEDLRAVLDRGLAARAAG
jgi:PAS domain S-box-containing protein